MPTVLEYLEGYFGGQLNESITDDDIMEAFYDLLETADAVEVYLNEIGGEVNELKLPKGRMPFSKVSKKQAVQSFVHGLRNPKRVRRSDPAGKMTSRRWDDSPSKDRPADYGMSGADLSRGGKPSRRQKRSEFRGVARRPIARGLVHAMSLGGTAIGSLDQAAANRAMRKKRASVLRKRASEKPT